MNTVLFVAFSHSLTASQIEGFKMQYGTPYYQEGCGAGGEEPSAFDAKIVNLAEVAPELQKQMSAIPATATLGDIQELAKAIVAEAVKVGATHFFCTGEPTLTMWANLYANQLPPYEAAIESSIESAIEVLDYIHNNPKDFIVDYRPVITKMLCIQSTTERRSVEVTNPDGTVTKTAVFQHVQWRKMF